MLRKLLQSSFVIIVVKHIFAISSFNEIFVPVFLVSGHHHDQGGEEMPVLIRTIPSFPGYFSAGQSITVLRRIRGRYCFFYTGHIFVSRLLSWDLFRQPIAVSDISIYICLIDIRDGSGKPVYGGVDRLQALSSAKTGRRSCFFMN